MRENKNCTFCKKHHDNVDTLVISDNANICNECVDICSIIVEMHEEAKIVNHKHRN